MPKSLFSPSSNSSQETGNNNKPTPRLITLIPLNYPEAVLDDVAIRAVKLTLNAFIQLYNDRQTQGLRHINMCGIELVRPRSGGFVCRCDGDSHARNLLRAIARIDWSSTVVPQGIRGVTSESLEGMNVLRLRVSDSLLDWPNLTRSISFYNPHIDTSKWKKLWIKTQRDQNSGVTHREFFFLALPDELVTTLMNSAKKMLRLKHDSTAVYSILTPASNSDNLRGKTSHNQTSLLCLTLLYYFSSSQQCAKHFPGRA